MRGRRLTAAAVVVAVVSLPFGAAAPAVADTIRSGEYWLGDYGIADAWKVTRGKGVTIAIIDTGVDGTHTDLRGAVLAGEDFTGHGRGGKPVNGERHGTMVASLAAGRGHGSGDGVIGAAPEASILSASIAFGDGVDSDGQVADAINWAIDNGADVINMSFTRETLDWPESWDAAFLRAEEAGVVMVAAAGNRGGGSSIVGAPATIPGVLTVAGLDSSGHASDKASAQGITIGVAAPSEQLVGALPGGGYASWKGTSGATPIVAGVVALVKAAHPDFTAGEIVARVIGTAKPAGSPGVDSLYGYGLLDAAAAVSDAAVPASITAQMDAAHGNPLGDLTEWIRLNRRAPSEPVLVAPIELPAPTEAAADPIAALLPSTALLRNVGVPVAVIAGFALAVLLVVAAAVRHVGRGRRTR